MESDILLVEENFATFVAPRLEAFGDRFYCRLFNRYPALEPLFRSPPEVQGEHFTTALRLIVTNFRDPASLEPLLLTLGGAHAGYRVEPRHYSQVGENLVSTLREMSGAAWSPELERAWYRAYESIVGHFRDEAERAQRRSSTPPHESDLLGMAAEYLSLARLRRSNGCLSPGEAARHAQLRDRLEIRLGRPPGLTPRRRDLRVRANTRLDFVSGRLQGHGLLATVSDRGLFVTTRQIVDPGEKIRVRIREDPNGGPIEVSGIVVWNRPTQTPEGPSGIAVSLEESDPRILSLVGRWLFFELDRRHQNET